MKLPAIVSSFVLLTLLGLPAPADTITLKSGEKINGKVLKDEPQQLTIEYKASASIVDTRVVPKSDVEKVEKEAPEDTDFAALKVPTKVGANSLPAEAYDPIITQLETYVRTYPASAHAKELTPVVEALKDEKKRVQEGAIKLRTKWYTREDVEKERYQLTANVLFAQMQDQARRNDLVGALNNFDEIDRHYQGAAAYPDAVDLAKQILPQLKQKIDRAIEYFRNQKSETDATTRLTPEPRRSQMIALQKLEQDKLDAAVEAAAKAGIKWPPFVSRSEKVLRTILINVTPEITRLGTLPVAKMREANTYAEKGRAAALAKDYKAARDALGKATLAWGPNELALRLNREYADNPAFAAADNAYAASLAPPATPAATPAPVVQKPAPPVPVEEPQKPLFQTPLGYGLIVVIAAAIIYLGFKIRAAQIAAERARYEAARAARAHEIDEHLRNPLDPFNLDDHPHSSD